MVLHKRFNFYYIKYGWLLLLGILALVVVDFGQLKVPELYRMVINGMNTGVVDFKGVTVPFDMNFLLDNICRPLLIVVLLICLGRFAWRICFFGAAIRVEADVRRRMFDRAKDLSQQYYHVNKVGDLMSLFTNDVESVQECFGSGVLTFFDAAVLGSMAFVKMLNMNGTLTALAMIPMIILFIMALIIGKQESKAWDKRQEAFSALSDFSQESFSGIAVIKAFTKEMFELMAFKKLNKDNEKANVRFTRISTLMNILFVFFVETVICVIVGYGGFLVHSGTMNAGELMEFISYFTTIIWPIEAIAILIDMSARASASTKRIDKFLSAPIDVCDREGLSQEPVDVKGTIEFKHLTFNYPLTERKALEDISFTINAGENVGLIGRTGAGKTTIVDLIARTYNVDDGMLFVDGRDVNDIPIKELRRHIAYVPQDNFLFSDTIAANIAFSQENDSDREAVETAARMSDVHDNIYEFADKYDTILGERGVTVSGGQKQRISIARALMKDAEILILDDSVSAVDTKTEKVILQNLRNTRKGKTTILIAHRISTIEGMDKIIFIDEGKVSDVGTHAELLLRNPAYQKMVKLQELEDKEKEDEKNA
ncbi:MAG: ABC transporter ATP-binding protein/permease [Lachnospiraceae bacterium]|nr:ABC transporter ATP-binding protein/permease [Lachnospiraceae bacterium]